MRRTIFAIAVVIALLLLGQFGAAAASRPVVLIFEVNKGDGADKALAASTTKALRNYFRDTQRVEAILFDRESPTVLRAIMDKQLSADQVASYSSQDQRLQVAKALIYQYAAGAEISVKDSTVKVKLWLAKTDGGKRDKWETSGSATSGGTSDENYDNAMQSAASVAVIDMARLALMKLPKIVEKDPTTADQSTAIGADMVPPPAPPTAADYTAQADTSMKTGNLAVAIQQYSQAVNADPGNVALRIKLADAYAHKGLYDEANAELDRAAGMGASADDIAVEKSKIAEMQGQAPAKPEPKTLPPTQITVPDNRPSSDPAAAAVSKMREGDKLWAQSKPDEAAESYKEAIKLNPSDWRAYERLAVVDASMSLFSESRTVLTQLASVQPSPSPEIISNRYQMFRKIFDRYFTALFKQYDSDAADYGRHAITRESYYSSTKGLAARLESMAKFMDYITVPAGKQPANLHRGLACGLVAQAAASLIDYLETNNADSKSNAQTFVAQAKKEVEAATNLETSSGLVVQQQPAETAQPVEAPATTEPAPDSTQIDTPAPETAPGPDAPPASDANRGPDALPSPQGYGPPAR